MGNIFRDNLKVQRLTAESMGMTEDEFSNWQIEWWQAIKKMNKEVENVGITYPIAGKSVTITLTKKNRTDYLDLNEQNN